MIPIQWPADADSSATIPAVVAALEWEMGGDPASCVDVKSNLPVNSRTTSFLIDNGELTEIDIWVTDRLPKGEDASCVGLAFLEIAKSLSERLGRASGRGNKRWWDLPSGGRL